jgi:S-(hydroxymethyl)glutathione dehydrogenase/alcohol dehydrogenase
LLEARASAIEEVEVGTKTVILLHVKATGSRHTDAYTLSGKDPEASFLPSWAHEGGAVVMEVGSGVTSVRPTTT